MTLLVIVNPKVTKSICMFVWPKRMLFSSIIMSLCPPVTTCLETPVTSGLITQACKTPVDVIVIPSPVPLYVSCALFPISLLETVIPVCRYSLPSVNWQTPLLSANCNANVSSTMPLPTDPSLSTLVTSSARNTSANVGAPVHATMLNVFAVTPEAKTTSHTPPPPFPVLRSLTWQTLPTTNSVKLTAVASVVNSYAWDRSLIKETLTTHLLPAPGSS